MAAALVAGATSCGGGDGDEAGAPALARDAGAVVERLERAIARRDFALVCERLLSAEVRRQAGAGECPAMLERTSAGVRRPRIEIKRIDIEGSVARVEVVTVAAGQARVPDTIRLVREGGGYRISSLSG